MRRFRASSFARCVLPIAPALAAGCSSSSAPTPTATPTPKPSPAGFTITGTPATTYARLDAEMQSFMQEYGIRAGQLAIGKATTLAVSAQSVATYAGHDNVYGLGGRVPGSACDGSINGTSSWTESLGDGYDFAFIFNTRVDRNVNEFDLTPLTSYLEEHI